MPPKTRKTRTAIERIVIGQMLDYWGAGILTKDDRTRERPVVALRASEWQPRTAPLGSSDLPQPRLEDQLRPVLNYADRKERIESAESAISHVNDRHSSLGVVPEVEELQAKLKLQVLSDGRILEYRDIGVPDGWAREGISLFVAKANHSSRRVRGQGGYAGRSRERGRVHVAA